MPITPTLSEMILKKDSAYMLKEKAIAEGMKTTVPGCMIASWGGFIVWIG
jgi:hypothetical protein